MRGLIGNWIPRPSGLASKHSWTNEEEAKRYTKWSYPIFSSNFGRLGSMYISSDIKVKAQKKRKEKGGGFVVFFFLYFLYSNLVGYYAVWSKKKKKRKKIFVSIIHPIAFFPFFFFFLLKFAVKTRGKAKEPVRSAGSIPRTDASSNVRLHVFMPSGVLNWISFNFPTLKSIRFT